MATTHHPAPAHAGFGQHHEWLWITLGAVVIAIVAVAITWAVTQPGTETATSPAAVSGFEYDHEVTPIHLASEGVTTQYFGYSGALFPEIVSEYDHETTPMHLVTGRVTAPFVGESGELDPEK